jgi:hypothetical protein
MEKTQDENGKIIYASSMPGKTTTKDLPYFFDEVFALRAERDDKGDIQRMLQTQPDGKWTAKDRSGKLDAYEPADFGAIIKKIQGGGE